jgi:hypothetical protein
MKKQTKQFNQCTKRQSWAGHSLSKLLEVNRKKASSRKDDLQRLVVLHLSDETAETKYVQEVEAERGESQDQEYGTETTGKSQDEADGDLKEVVMTYAIKSVKQRWLDTR